MVTSLLTSKALRSKYLTAAAYKHAVSSNLKAVVISPTSGIGKGCSHRLAEQGYTVIAIGRHRPGRAEAIIEELNAKSRSALKQNENEEAQFPAHEFYSVDAFSLEDIQKTAQEIILKHPTIDVVVLTQGMATTQGFTPTKEGNDEKMTLHYFSRIAMANALLPALRNSASSNSNCRMKNGPVVISILSGGVHGPYEKYQEDFSLENNYSVGNAADAGGFYNDLGLDELASKDENKGINFVHASPGFINTNWGSEFNLILKCMVRMMQPLGRDPKDCAEYMLGPTVFASAGGDSLPKRLDEASGQRLFVMGEKGQSKGLTNMHTTDAKAFVWEQTVEVLKKAGIKIE